MNDTPPPRRSAVVIWAGMMSGMVLFSGSLVELSAKMAVPVDDFIGRILLPLVVVQLVASFVVPARLKSQPPFARHLIGCALAEAAGLLSAVGFMVTRDQLMLGGLGFSLLALLLRFPSENRWSALQTDETRPAE